MSVPRKRETKMAEKTNYDDLINRLQKASECSMVLSMFFPEDGNSMKKLFDDAVEAIEELINERG